MEINAPTPRGAIFSATTLTHRLRFEFRPYLRRLPINPNIPSPTTIAVPGSGVATVNV